MSVSVLGGPQQFTVVKLYRDLLRLADYVSLQTGNRHTLRKTVIDQFRRNAAETDPKKVEEHRQAAVRALNNYMFHEAQRLAKNEELLRDPEQL